MEKSLLQAQRQAILEIENEVTIQKSKEDAQMQVEKIITSRELNDLKLKQAEYHREVALLRAEQLKLEEIRAKYQAEFDIFNHEKSNYERKIREAMKLHEETGLFEQGFVKCEIHPPFVSSFY